MKLSREEIQIIERTLLDKGVFYEDVKLELIDHIASDIENQLENNKSNFEKAFQTVFNKWDGLLETTSSSFWLGMLFQAPKVVVDKLVSYSKRQAVIVLILALVFGILLATIISDIQQEKFFYTLNLGLTGVFFLMVLATIVSLFLIWKSKVKTTYGRLFLFRGWITFVFFYQCNINGDPLYSFNVNHSLGDNFIICFLFGLEFFYSFYQIKMTLEHFEIVKKHKLV
ncbi:hypothetical protein [Flavobacterium sp. ZB4P13]|uniref:hypothetical protein n=1 Tax=Flavobacterium sp. ZB4P13 TaxID=3401728 RepID=UPI003AAE754A